MELLANERMYRAETPRQQPHQRILQETGDSCGRVLIVEDEVELLEILKSNLVRQGFEVLVSADGLDACRVIGREKPALILLNLLLPTLNGWEICRMVRTQQDPVLAQTPIIMLSTLGSADDRIKGYGLGADMYLSKPYNIKDIVLKSRQLITQQHARLSKNPAALDEDAIVAPGAAV